MIIFASAKGARCGRSKANVAANRADRDSFTPSATRSVENDDTCFLFPVSLSYTFHSVKNRYAITKFFESKYGL